MLLIIISSSLLIPFSSISNTVYGNNSDSNYYYSSNLFDSNNEKSDNDDNNKKYSYQSPSEDDYKIDKDLVLNCKECFFSELEILDEKTAERILYAIDKKFGDITKLCELIVNGKIDKDQLEKILLNIIFYFDYYDDDNKNLQYDYYNQYDDYDDYSYNYQNTRNGEYDYSYSYDDNEYYQEGTFLHDNEYENNKYYYFDNYNENGKYSIQFIQNVINCLFPIIYAVWHDDPLGNRDILISKSTDGGETFSPPENISNNTGVSNEPSLWAEGNSVYVVWSDNTSGNEEILISKSTDEGETFTPPENISNNTDVSEVPVITVDGNTVYVVWHDFTGTTGNQDILIAKSTDGGETFTPPENISEDRGFSSYPAISLYENNIFIVWSDNSEGFFNIYITKSTDEGETFSIPKIIGENKGLSYTPSIFFDKGIIYVAWSSSPFEERDIFVAKSTDGGETFTPPENISENVSFSHQTALAVNGNNVYVVWIVETLDNNDVYIAKSTDGGETFTPPENISDNDGYSSYESAAFDNFIEPSISINNNNIYVTWHDGSFGNFEILLVTSRDGGETYSTPHNISDNDSDSLEPEITLSQ